MAEEGSAATRDEEKEERTAEEDMLEAVLPPERARWQAPAQTKGQRHPLLIEPLCLTLQDCVRALAHGGLPLRWAH